jgi:hypothetical protein
MHKNKVSNTMKKHKQFSYENQYVCNKFFNFTIKNNTVWRMFYNVYIFIEYMFIHDWILSKILMLIFLIVIVYIHECVRYLKIFMSQCKHKHKFVFVDIALMKINYGRIFCQNNVWVDIGCWLKVNFYRKLPTFPLFDYINSINRFLLRFLTLKPD